MPDSYSTYQEATFDQIVGNDTAIKLLKEYANDIDNGKARRPIMLSGPSGTGKSLAAHIIAREHGWHIVEMNASDYRNEEAINRVTMAASQSKTIFGARNIILLDEIDELSGRFDKGGSAAISKMIRTAKSPIIFVANDRWSQRISFLRMIVDYIEFKKLTSMEIAKILKIKVKQNSLKVSDDMIEALSKRTNGDARSSLNDLFVLDGAPLEAMEIVSLRDTKVDIFNTLDKIFFSNTFSAPLAAAQNADVENDMLVRWVDENLPKRYTNALDLYRGFESLSLATMYLTRASRTQYYTYWRYMNAFVTSGIALAKDNYPDKLRRYGFPTVISQLSKSKENRGTGNSIALKLQRKMHSSRSRIIKNEMKILAQMCRNFSQREKENEKIYEFFVIKFGLEPKEVDWMMENS